MQESLLIFFCLAITLHNLEEALWLPQWSQQPSKFQRAVSTNEFHFAVLVITSLAYLSAFSYFYFPESILVKWVFIGFLGSMILNAIFPHLLATIVMKKYAPGLLTGVLLNIPINSLILYRMFMDELISLKETVFSTIIVGPILILVIPLLFRIGKRIFPVY
ncbi:hypothetical protein BAOM_2784 [Peribacillus asahii]|uniref:HXXEE domain-containing protein n=1 Tax=Peribacillus asahii TaxID=228899 RepID=A0A3T0KSZ5_9BACI|nr:HXXEE domain-containing protein [Peribacillus asahii]AZV43393.1 hypothetical protein BAOM_2784 [Peribacillus asahii]